MHNNTSKKVKDFRQDRGFDITSLREILIMKRLKNIAKLEEILYIQTKEKNKKNERFILYFLIWNNIYQ